MFSFSSFEERNRRHFFLTANGFNEVTGGSLKTGNGADELTGGSLKTGSASVEVTGGSLKT